jgi:hypothetical protein
MDEAQTGEFNSPGPGVEIWIRDYEESLVNQPQSVHQECYIHEEEKLDEVMYQSNRLGPPITSIVGYFILYLHVRMWWEWLIL